MTAQYGEGKYGDGQYGGLVSANTINVRITKRTASAVTLQWDPVSADGFLYLRNGKHISSTYDGTRTSANFSYTGGDVLSVVPIRMLPGGQVTA